MNLLMNDKIKDNMKKILCAWGILMIGLILTSCEIDNYDGPDASFEGKILDIETGELIQQENINENSLIYYIEEGWDDKNPLIQTMRFKNDGTFNNNMMFSGKYKIIMNQGNYVPVVDTLRMTINKGKNYHEFKVLPYLRFFESSIKLEGRTVTARCKIDRTTSYNIYRVSLFGHPHHDVANGLNMFHLFTDVHTATTRDDEFVISFSLDTYPSILKSGQSYWFRIGAWSNGVATKYNYSSAVKITIP